MYEYRAEILRVIDGDTVVARIDLGFHVSVVEHLRLAGIDAPEMRGEERTRGVAAKTHLERLVEQFGPVVVRTEKDRTGKYGRYLATLIGQAEYGAVELNAAMVKDGFARWRK